MSDDVFSEIQSSPCALCNSQEGVVDCQFYIGEGRYWWSGNIVVSHGYREENFRPESLHLCLRCIKKTRSGHFANILLLLFLSLLFSGLLVWGILTAWQQDRVGLCVLLGVIVFVLLILALAFLVTLIGDLAYERPFNSRAGTILHRKLNPSKQIIRKANGSTEGTLIYLTQSQALRRLGYK